MANPYTSGHGVDPFVEEVTRPRPVAPTASQPPPAQNPQFYDPPAPSSTAAAQSQAYSPPPVNSSSAAAIPPAVAAAPPSATPGAAIAPEARDLQTSKFWTLEFYQQFFDVDTQDVALRMGNTLLPFLPPDFLANRNWHHGNLPGGDRFKLMGAAFTATTERQPDIYGPFWICTTLWVTLAIVGNIMSRLAYNKRVRELPTGTPALGPWSYDFTVASVACFTVYAFCGLMPLCVWGLMLWKAVPAGLIDVLCLYGYSMFTFLLAAILCAFPSDGFQWAACIICGLWSLLYLFANFWKLWRQTLEKAWFVGVVAFVAFAHVGLFLAFKLYFLRYNF